MGCFPAQSRGEYHSPDRVLTMYVEVVPTPEGGDVQFCAAPSAYFWRDHPQAGARVVVVFTTPSEAEDALNLAFRLAVSPSVRVLLVCPVTRSLAGLLRLGLCLRFAKRRLASLAQKSSAPLRMLIWPCKAGCDVIDRFISARSIVIIRRRWWRSWDRTARETVVMHTNKLVLLL